MLRNTRTRTQQAQQVRRTSPRNLQQQQPQQQQPQTKQLQPGQGNRALVKPRTQRRLTKVARVEANWNEVSPCATCCSSSSTAMLCKNEFSMDSMCGQCLCASLTAVRVKLARHLTPHDK
jgi:hypothetical protein